MHVLASVDSWRQPSRDSKPYDYFIATIGYETRARYFADRRRPKASRKLAIGFSNRTVIGYADNRSWYMRNDYEVHEGDDGQFTALVQRISDEMARAERPLRVCVDISSLTRWRLATWVDAIRALDHDYPVHIDFVYSAARYSDPPRLLGQNRNVGPLPGFAGWTEPALPLTVVVGVGYERNKALGAVRYLDPEETWAFVPTGHQAKYTRKIDKANSHLWDIIPVSQRIEYSVWRPFDCLVTLESFVCGAMRESKVTLLPFGPKTFALCSLLVACIHTEVPVWRVSSGHEGEPTDRIPNGKVVGLSTSFAAVSEQLAGYDRGDAIGVE